MRYHSGATVTCLLAIDIGNTNTVLGVYRGDELVCHWRIQTDQHRTDDEYAMLLRDLMALRGFELGDIGHSIMSSVVPPVVQELVALFDRYLDAPALIVGPGMRTGMPILYENPREVGADRIVSAIAAFDRFASGCVVVDFGTATTWDVVTPKGEYLGGVIAPGLSISAEALYEHAAKLPRVEVTQPRKVVGRNTVASMQSGLFHGYLGMVDSVVEAIRREVDFEVHCIATGGLAALFADESKVIEATDEMLTLRGLKILFERNQ